MIDPVRLRREADFVLKDLRSPDDARALAAALRFVRLPALSDLEPEEVRRRAAKVRRSHALDLIATEHGFSSWGDVARAAGGPVAVTTPARAPDAGQRSRSRPPQTPAPEELAARVAERVLYFAEPLSFQAGGGHRLDVQRVKEEALAAILDALRYHPSTDGSAAEVGDERFYS